VIASLQGGSPFEMRVRNPNLPRLGSRTAPSTFNQEWDTLESWRTWK